jgi:hypothetical protein
MTTVTPHLDRTAPVSLAYEQPLFPGEARLDVSDQCMALHWVPSTTTARHNFALAALLLGGFLVLPGVGALGTWFGDRRNGAATVVFAIFLLMTGASAAYLFLIFKARRRPHSIFADRESLVFSGPFANFHVKMSDVATFRAQPHARGWRLRATARTTFRKPRLLEFEGARAPEARVDLLDHTDAGLVRRAATALNALLLPPRVPSPAGVQSHDR